MRLGRYWQWSRGCTRSQQGASVCTACLRSLLPALALLCWSLPCAFCLAGAAVSPPAPGPQPLLRSTGCVCPSALAGFPLHEAPQDVLGFVEVQGQGIIGADFPCPMSVLPGKCAYEKLLDAATMCVDALQCTAVVWFFNGERGPTAGGSP